MFKFEGRPLLRLYRELLMCVSCPFIYLNFTDGLPLPSCEGLHTLAETREGGQINVG